MGADPLAHAAALVSWQKGQPIDAFSVRKFTKAHGTGGRVVGPCGRGRVVIVEDVITTGGSAREAIEAARDYGLDVVMVLVLVDRQEGGREAVEALAPGGDGVYHWQLKAPDK